VPAAIEAGTPPDLALGLALTGVVPSWAEAGKLVDLADLIEPIKGQFHPVALERVLLPSGPSGKKAYVALPILQDTVHVHVWTSLLEAAGLRVQDVPRDWATFWGFWCDKVQPAVRQATGRDDVYGIGAPMGPEAGDTNTSRGIFEIAHGLEHISPEGKPLYDDPAVRRGLIKAIEEYAAIYKKGCTPPDSTSWENPSNNKAFLAQQVVMTFNRTLSIPAALLGERPDDYYKNTATIDWPMGPDGKPFYLFSDVYSVLVFRDGKQVQTAKDFLRFMLGEGRLQRYIEAVGGRFLPTMPALAGGAFWSDPKDPHRPTSLRQSRERSGGYDYAVANKRWEDVSDEGVWAKAVNKVAAQDYPADKAVDEAIARTVEILSK
jgi:multiple sugar transport system substrate-binding protein